VHTAVIVKEIEEIQTCEDEVQKSESVKEEEEKGPVRETLARLAEIQGTVTAAASRKGEAGQWYVECSVDGRMQLMMVDTGCTVTMLDVDVYREWSGGSLEGLNQTGTAYTGVTGSDLTIFGWKDMVIELAGERLCHRVIVAEMALNGILGMDALVKMGCRMDFGSGEMRVREKVVELQGRRLPCLHQLVTMEEEIVGSCVEQVVQLRVQSSVRTVPSEGIVVPLEGGPVIIGRALVKVQKEKVLTSLLNPCKDVRVIPAGTVVAILEEILEVVKMPLEGFRGENPSTEEILEVVKMPLEGFRGDSEGKIDQPKKSLR